MWAYFYEFGCTHGVISQKLNRDKFIFTPNHFIEQIKESRNNAIVRAFTHEDILMFDNKCKSNASKIFSISDVKQSQLRTNSFDIHVKFDHEKDFQTFDILEKTFKNSLMNSRSILFLNDFPKKLIPCGVSQQKLDNLKKKILKILKKITKLFMKIYILIINSMKLLMI